MSDIPFWWWWCLALLWVVVVVSYCVGGDGGPY